MKILLLVAALFSFYSFGQEKEVKDAKSTEILNKLSAKIKSYKTFYLEFNATIKSATGVNESETGKGWVKDKKYYASYGNNTIISNGIKTWTIVKEDKSVYESDADDADDESMNPKKLMTIWESGFKSKYDKEETLNGEKVHVINLYPKNPKTVNYHTIILYVSVAGGDLKKAIMKGKDGTVMTYSLTKLVPNETIEDSKFVFDIKKYPGYQLIKD
jgi:outer membrane lipoprotein-sorting protein